MGNTVETVHGLRITDPYRWMEGKDNKTFNDWLIAQGAYGRQVLNGSKTLSFWQKRLNAASAESVRFRMQHQVNGKLFYMKAEKGQQGVLIVRDPSGRERILFDPNLTKVAGEHQSITRYSPSPDGKTIAVNIDRGGDEITTVEFYNSDTGAKLKDEVKNVWGEFTANWSPDSKAFTLTTLALNLGPKDDPALNMRTIYHVLGTDPQTDKVLISPDPKSAFVDQAAELPGAALNFDSQWAAITLGGARNQIRVCLVKKDNLLGSKPYNIHCLADYDDSIIDYALKGNTLYILSQKGTPNGALLSLDLNAPILALANAKTLIGEDKEIVLTGLAITKSHLYVQRMHKGLNDFSQYALDTGKITTLSLPYDGAVYWVDANPFESQLIFTLQSWTKPTALFAYDPDKAVMADLHQNNIMPKLYDHDVSVRDLEIPSLDGTLVPITIVQPKTFRPKHPHKAILDGYAGYGQITQPFFDAMSLEWVKAGNLYVWVGARGGGEKGESWHVAGQGPRKFKGVEDMIATADALKRMHYSDYDHMAVYGASMGGVLIGGAITRAPDHFAAAIIHAGILNAARLEFMPNGPNQYAEMGDPRTTEGFKALYDMDPYLHIKQGTAYPAVLLDVGLNDNRVVPWNSGKFGAALLASTHSSRPILYRTDADTGHFGTSLNQQAAEMADHYAFLDLVMDTPNQPLRPKIAKHRKHH